MADSDTQQTESKPEEFRLLELPAELRANIYGYALASINPIDIIKGNVQLFPTLLRICSQIRSEYVLP